MALRYVADLPVGQIATIMGVAPGTAASTLHAARARLARVLAPADLAVEESTDACRR